MVENSANSDLAVRTKKPGRRWFHITPDRVLVGLLAVETCLFLFGRFRQALTDEKPGWSALIALAVVAATLLVLLIWFAIAFVLRRRFQFGLRSLLGLVATVALVSNWLAIDLRRATRQREAVDAIRDEGGSALYEHDFVASANLSQSRKKVVTSLPNGGTVIMWKIERQEPDWLSTFLDSNFFYNVVLVEVKTDAGLAKIDALTHLKTLDLSDRHVTDAGLEHLKGLSQLEYLDLWRTPITDGGVGHLSGLDQLQWLDLSHTKITDAALQRLAKLSELRLLNLSTNAITDAGLMQLHGLTHLQTLKLFGTQVTAEGVASLRRVLPNCTIYVDPAEATGRDEAIRDRPAGAN